MTTSGHCSTGLPMTRYEGSFVGLRRPGGSNPTRTRVAAGVPCFVKQVGAVVHDRNDAGFDAYMEVDTETGLPTFPTPTAEPRRKCV